MENARNTLVGERIRYYRTARRFSLEKLSEKLPDPLSAQQLAKYETGASRWPADLVCDIAVILRTDVRLLTGMESGKHEVRDNDEWDAERYKTKLLELSEKARRVIYRVIDGIAGL